MPAAIRQTFTHSNELTTDEAKGRTSGLQWEFVWAELPCWGVHAEARQRAPKAAWAPSPGGLSTLLDLKPSPCQQNASPKASGQPKILSSTLRQPDPVLCPMNELFLKLGTALHGESAQAQLCLRRTLRLHRLCTQYQRRRCGCGWVL